MQAAVSGTLTRHNIDIFGILETKIKELCDLHDILQSRFQGWRATHNFLQVPGGRILVIWNPQTVELQTSHVAEQFIHCSMRCLRTQTVIQITFVYGLHTVVNRQPSWAGLNDIGERMTDPWLCMGDFNAYLKPNERTGGQAINTYMVRDFEICCISNGLSDLNSTGLFYTWWNNSERAVWGKLDRALVNQYWLESSFVSTTQFLPMGWASDHAPCIVSLQDAFVTSMRPFRFFNI